MIRLNWVKNTKGGWCSFSQVDLSHQAFDGTAGVYMIFYMGSGGEPGSVVRLGQGVIGERIAAHRQDWDITRHGLSQNLLVTWAAVPAHQRDGVEKFLADFFSPLEGERFPSRAPIGVSSPFQ